MSNPRSISGSVREGTRVVLREITASLHNSPPLQPPRCKSVSDNSLQKTAEHEVKVRFAREFADVGSVTYSAPESLSSASSFQSLSSSLSTKSSSGICPDSVPQSPNQVADTSYLNNSIHGVEDLILGCATIRLSSEEESSFKALEVNQDLSENHSFNELETTQDISPNHTLKALDVTQDLSQNHSSNELQTAQDISPNHSLKALDITQDLSQNHSLNELQTTQDISPNHSLKALDVTQDLSQNHSLNELQTTQDISPNHSLKALDVTQDLSQNHSSNELQTTQHISPNHSFKALDVTQDLSQNHSSKELQTAQDISPNHSLKALDVTQDLSQNHSSNELQTAQDISPNHSLKALEVTQDLGQNHSFNELQTTQDISQDQTFSSAIGGPELTRELIKDISPLSSDNILQGVEESSSRRSSLVNRLHDVEERPILIVPNALVVEEPTKGPVFPKESDDLISSPEISSLTNIEELPLSQHSGEGSSLNSTICLSAVKEGESFSKPEEHIAPENTEVKAELLSVNVIPSSAVDSVDSVSALLEHAEGPSLPSISAVSLLSLTGSTKLSESETCEVGEDVKSLLVRSSSPINGTNEGAITLSQNVLKSPDQDIQDTHSSRAESISPSFYDATDGGESRAVLLNDTPLSTLKTLKLEEHLEINVPKGNECSKTFDSDVELSSKVDSLKVDVSPLATKEPVDDNKSEVFLSAQGTNIIEEANAINAAKQIELEETEEQSSEEKLDKTLTFQDNSLKSDSVQEIEQYTDFKPQRQSTTLALPVEQPNFDELKAAAEQIADDIFKTSLEFSEDNDCFITATPDIFQDPTSFDFLINHGNKKTINRLRNDSLYVKFDPLVTDTSMLPQGNSPPMNEEQNGKTESPPPNIVTPKRNPAIAAIDRLLFYSPLCTSMTQKMEEPLEKIKPTTEEPKSDAPLVNDINMSKELELVRATVLQLEEELEKQKKEYEAELERQKNSFQEKINKLQAQIAQEVKSKSEMTVVIGEYERSISRMLTEVERDRTTFEQEKTKVQEELHTTNVHLTNTEAAFNDVHQKYERLKGVVTVYKNNEAVLKESIQENLETIKSLETRYDNLKNHALIQLENANLELDTMRKQHQDETVKLHAMVRKAELKSNSLAELVEQKTKENKELAQILDEVIARVGHQNAE